MRVCLIKTSALGDIVQTFPLVSYLKQRYPDAMIDWVVERPHLELVASHPQVNQVIPVNTHLWRRQPVASWGEIAAFRQAVRSTPYDITFDLQGNLKSGLLASQIKSPAKVGYAWKSAPEWPNVLFTNRRYGSKPGATIREDYLNLVQSYFDDPQPFVDPGIALVISAMQQQAIAKILSTPALGSGPKVLVSPGSAWPNKQLTLPALQQMLQRVQAQLRCGFLFAWGSTEEKIQAIALHEACPHNSILLERQPLAMLQNLMRELDLVIAMDSLPLHLAASAGTPTYGFFGPSSGHKYNPSGPNHGFFQGACPYGRTFHKRCPVLRTCPTGACLHDQPADTLFGAFMGWWKEKGIRT